MPKNKLGRDDRWKHNATQPTPASRVPGRHRARNSRRRFVTSTAGATFFHVRNADDMADARALVLSELGDVQSLVIARRH